MRTMRASRCLAERRIVRLPAIALCLLAALSLVAAGSVRVSGRATYGYGGSVHVHGGYWGGGYWGGCWGPYWGGYWGFGPYWPAWGPVYPPGWVVRVGDPRSGPAILETRVKPKRAEVWVDGKLAGEARDFSGTWDRMWIEPGEHSLELREDGYRTLRVVLDLAPGGYARIEQRLQKGEGLDPRSDEAPPAPAPTDSALRRALVRFDVEPADAAVYLDGEFLANGDELSRLHGAIPVAEGRHSVEVVRPGYEAERQEIEASAAEPVRVRIVLRKADG